MILQVYSVFDEKAKAYMTPFFQQTNGMAQRAFSDAVNDRDHAFCRHPDDYFLFRVGSFNDETGEFETAVPPENLGGALVYVVMEAGGPFIREVTENIHETINEENENGS